MAFLAGGIFALSRLIEDAKFKYTDPLTNPDPGKEPTADYLSMLQGSKAQQRKEIPIPAGTQKRPKAESDIGTRSPRVDRISMSRDGKKGIPDCREV